MPFPDAGNSSSAADAAPPTPTTACAEGELEGPDESCFFLDARTQSFFAARDVCQARGSGWDLASVRSADVSAFLGDALTFEGWLLASDVASEGTWVWLDDGSPFWQGGSTGTPIAGAYGNWNATEPNGGNTTNCMRALPRSAGSANPNAPWADLACTELRGAICEGPLP
jgi:lectin-like protein